MDDPTRLSLSEATSALERGVFSARELTEFYLTRIADLDHSGPTLRSVLSVNASALEQADTLDRERRVGRVRGPLHGVPVLLKDNIETRELPTTAGSLALRGSQPARDAAVTERLRAAGAVILGKTNLSEWANFRGRRSSSGWSSLGGQTKNPYALNRNPCGSSSGSGAAVAAGLAAAAIGTETDGSVVCPASLCGVVGHKPTVGLVSRRGIIPISHSQDTAGPMTRTVADAALLLSVLAGEDAHDPATLGLAAPGEFEARQDLKGVRLGVVRSLFGNHGGADAVAERALELLRDLGADLVDDLTLEHAEALKESKYQVLLFEFKDGLGRYFASLGAGAPLGSLGDLIAFNEAHREAVMPYFGQEHVLAAQAKGPLSERAYLEARETCLRLSRSEGIDRLLNDHRLDALLAPTAGPAWVTDPVTGDHYTGSSSSFPAVAGYPHVTVPAGLVHGLPVGLSFFGAAHHDVRLLRFAHAFETAREPLPPPSFAPTLP